MTNNDGTLTETEIAVAPALPAIGARARLRCPAERLAHFHTELAATGSVTEASEHLIAMRMDAPVSGAGAGDWDNLLCWMPADGEAITGPDATSAEQVAAAFHADAELIPPLGFIDHHRQRYAKKVPIETAGEFNVGDYNEDGPLGADGGFTVALIELGNGGRWGQYPQLQAFGDGAEALRRAIDLGLLNALGRVCDHEEFSQGLVDRGFVDRSDIGREG
jgi:hypothetical protein